LIEETEKQLSEQQLAQARQLAVDWRRAHPATSD
jgi:hypothetical protein